MRNVRRDVTSAVHGSARCVTKVASIAEAFVRRGEFDNVDLICIFLDRTDRQIRDWSSFDLPSKPLRIGIANSASPAQAKLALELGFDDYLSTAVGAFGIQTALERHLRFKFLRDATSYAETIESIWTESPDFAALKLNASGQIDRTSAIAEQWLRSLGCNGLIGLNCLEIFGYDIYQLRERSSITLPSEAGQQIFFGVTVISIGELGIRGFLLLLSRRQSQSELLSNSVSLHEAYLSEINHELRTPLSSIVGSLSLLSSQTLGSSQAEVSELIDVALRNSVRLSQLVDDVLDINKIDTDSLFLRFSNVRVYELLLDTIQLNRNYSSETELRLVGTIDRELIVNVDASRFGQVMTNLLSNAIKYSPVGCTVDIAIQQRVREGICEVAISVRDYGRGIAPESLKRLFLKYSATPELQATTVKSNGLGLYITKRLVEKMGGIITVDSTIGLGTTFTVCFKKSFESAITAEKISLQNEMGGQQNEQATQSVIC